MAKPKGSADGNYREMAPALNPEVEESRCISMAMNLVQKRLRDGSASSQEVTHFLKLGSRKEVLEREKLEEENKLLKAKTEALKSQQNMESIYIDAIAAMKSYSGQSQGDEYDEY